MILFLDFDGVTHPVSGSPPFKDECINALSTVVSKLDASIVITSTWRYDKTIDELRNLLGAELGERVIDITPMLDIDPFMHWPRAREVNAWINEHYSHDKPWAAIDDEEGNYPEGNCYITDRVTGFTNADIEPIIKHIVIKEGNTNIMFKFL